MQGAFLALYSGPNDSPNSLVWQRTVESRQPYVYFDGKRTVEGWDVAEIVLFEPSSFLVMISRFSIVFFRCLTEHAYLVQI